MFKPKHVAPFFSMEPSALSEVLKDLRIIYPMEQTPLGSFLLKEKDLAVIEAFINTTNFFQDRKTAMINFKSYIDDNLEESEFPEWSSYIRELEL